MARQAKTDKTFYNGLAERLREAFGDDPATVISEKLGNVSISTLNYWRRGDARPDYEMLLKICMVYNVSADWLLGRPGAVKSPEEGMEAACKCTGFSEETIRAVQGNRFRRELEFILTDPNLDSLLKSFSRLSARMYDLQFTLEEIDKFTEEGKNDRYVVEKTARMRDELDHITETVELARFKVSEAALRTSESVYNVNGQLKKADHVLEQLDRAIETYEQR